MSWTDKQAVRAIKGLRDKYDITQFVETGTFMGVNAELQSNNFDEVYTCEVDQKYYSKSQRRIQQYSNILGLFKDSKKFLKLFRKDFEDRKKKGVPLFYLDAHFYDPSRPKGKGKFVVLDELKQLKGFGKCVIAVHDFDNNLGHIEYDGVSLDLDLLKNDLKNIYDFHYYTNSLDSCDIVRPVYDDIVSAGLKPDPETADNLRYAWKTPRLAFRGLLYCTPTRLTKKEQKELGLREWS